MSEELVNKTIGWRKQDLLENTYFKYLEKMEYCRKLDYAYHEKYDEILFLDYDIYGKFLACQGYFSDLKEHGENEHISKEHSVSVLTNFLFYSDLGSSRDEFFKTYRYEIYRDIVEAILSEKYNVLWNINYNELVANKEQIISALIDVRDTINNIFKKHLKSKKNINQTIITSILLGTFSCCPAYTTYFCKGLKQTKNFYNNNSVKKLISLICDNEIFDYLQAGEKYWNIMCVVYTIYSEIGLKSMYNKKEPKSEFIPIEEDELPF